MIKEDFIKKITEDYAAQTIARRDIVATSGPALFQAKTAIFSLQRNDLVTARQSLSVAEEILEKLQQKYAISRLEEEGSYRAALEEFSEASFLEQTILEQSLDVHPKVHLNYEAYLGGLFDLLGELVRLATNRAASGDLSAPAHFKEVASNILNQLSKSDFTGYLRTKYDQANGHLRKLEQMAYEIRLRQE